jgi:hypothetical protein
MMTRGNYAQLMAPGIHELMDQQTQLEQRDSEYDKVFNTPTSDKAFEDDVEFAGLGPMTTKPEGQPINYDDVIQGGSYRYTHSTVGQGVRYSFELLEDDQYGIIQKVPMNFARTAMHTKETNAWNVLNLGFTTQITVDGVSLFNAAHPLLGGLPATVAVPASIVGVGVYTQGTYPNRPGTDIDLSYSGLQLMINQCERMIDGRGLLVKCQINTIVVPPELRWVIEEILGSEWKPYTAENTVNVVNNKGLSPFIGRYLTSTKAWFGLGEKSRHKLNHFDRHPLDEDFADDFDTRSLKHVAFYRASDGASNWPGTWGSAGT